MAMKLSSGIGNNQKRANGYSSWDGYSKYFIFNSTLSPELSEVGWSRGLYPLKAGVYLASTTAAFPGFASSYPLPSDELN
ncbi:unnamed protein product [Nezara viridula]|uniref:Uncharacterized protein n=1 Tax=Nezara viridula TaxID=85310 RepID=A0A9P0HVB9_NEZVI|nr:unnamed protein product [Nezara viridula]